MKLLVSEYYNTRDDKWVYEILAVVASFEAMVRWLYENKKGISYRDIENLEDNHECDYLGLQLINIPLIPSGGVLQRRHYLKQDVKILWIFIWCFLIGIGLKVKGLRKFCN